MPTLNKFNKKWFGLFLFLFGFFLFSGARVAYSATNQCWCKNIVIGAGEFNGCTSYTADPIFRTPINSFNSCQFFCKSQNININSGQASGKLMFALYFDDKDHKDDDACKTHFCWCKSADNKVCEPSIKYLLNGYYTESQCKNYCSKEWVNDRGTPYVGGSMVYFVTDYTNYRSTDKCLGIAPPEKQPENLAETLTAEEAANKKKLADLRAGASSLNQLSVGLSTPQAFIGQAIRFLMSIIGSLMLLMMVYGGVLWMTASGNSEQVEKAKKIMVWAVLGVVVMLSSYLIINFIFNISVLNVGA